MNAALKGALRPLKGTLTSSTAQIRSARANFSPPGRVLSLSSFPLLGYVVQLVVISNSHFDMNVILHKAWSPMPLQPGFPLPVCPA